MQKGNKKILLFALIITFLFLGAQIFAQQGLEVEYPTVPGAERPETVTTPLPSLLKYVYNLSILFAGFLCFILVVWGGIKYILSAHNPGRRTDAREQINLAFLGIIIIFTSYLLLNTINPELVKLKINPSNVTSTPAFIFPEDVIKPYSQFIEVPVGTLMTSEYTASSFFIDPATDPDYDSEEYAKTFPDVSIYPTSFQGALLGRRLKRIHEVASTTLPVVDMLALLSEDLKYLTGKLNEKNNELVQLARSCDCVVCFCLGGGLGACVPNICPKCSGDPCPFRTRMNGLRQDVIPYYYTEDDDPIPCKILEIEYLSGAFEAFLDNTSQLVKNEEKQGNSYWYSSEAEDLRKKIEACIGAGSGDWINAELTIGDHEKIDKQYDEIEDLIDLMADVENKGTYTPITNPPERDIQTNVNHSEALLNAMKDIKRKMNPFDQEKGYLNLMSFSEAVSSEVDQQIEPEIKSYYVSFPGVTEAEEVDVKKDPATFYDSLPFVFPIDSEGTSQSQKIYSFFKNNIAWAQSTSSDESAPSTPAICDHLVEIPIGKASDEAIKLTQDILRELKNIWDQGHLIINHLNDQKNNAENMFPLSDTLIDLTSEDNCIKRCEDVPCEPTCLSYTIPVLFGIPIQMHSCTPPCFGPHPCRTLSQIIGTGGQIQANASNIETLYQQILNAEESIFESFFKLNSEYPEEYLHLGEWVPHPEAGERAPIGEDICCTDRLGNCRTSDWLIDNDKTEERSYTLKEKLAETQKLLNRAREVISPQKGEVSAYDLLINDLIDLDYAERRELQIPGINKMDIQNCLTLYEEIEAIESKEPCKQLLNCYFAQEIYAIDPLDQEVCSPDPYLDCDFFKFTEDRVKSTMSCYCYNKQTQDYSFYNQNRFPELYMGNFFLGFGNNYFCCVTKYE